MAAVMLERQGTQRLSVQRQLNQYRDHHFQRGVREVVGAWTDTLSGQPIENMLASDGHALDIELADGGFLAIYLFDAQGTIRSDPIGLNEEERTDAGGIYEQLMMLTGGVPTPAMLRPVGPVKVCIATAPEEVLVAIGNYVAGNNRTGRRFADEILDVRKRQSPTQADVDSASSAADFNAEQRQVLARLVTTTAELWGMVIDVYEPGSNGPKARYSGRFVPPGRGSGAVPTLQSLGKFLSWEELPVTGAGRQ
jgi:hypothetical protein